MALFTRANKQGAKLTPSLALEIREKYQAGATQGALARAYGISIGQIGRVVRGEAWQMPGALPIDPQAIREGEARLWAVQQSLTAGEQLAADAAREEGQTGNRLLDELGVSQEVKDKVKDIFGRG